MANPLKTFFSRLAPEDKRFIKKIWILLIILLVASGIILFLYTFFEKKSVEKSEKAELHSNIEDSTSGFELPPAPEIPEQIENHNSYQTPQQSDTHAPAIVNDFDEQAHLQLMRQNAKEYNYKMAYKHGARIMEYLLANSDLSAEWGHVLLGSGKPQEAVSVLQKIVSSDSVKSEISIDMAFAMLRSGDANGAVEFLDGKLSKNNDINLLVAKAAVMSEHSDTTKYATADSIFKYLLKSKVPPPPNTYYWYGRFLMQKGDYKNSKTYLERAVNAKPSEPRYLARLGMAEFYLKNDTGAETLYKKALNANPYDYNTWFNLGELYLSQANESSYIPTIRNKTINALESYLKAIETDSLNANAHYRIGLILNGNGSYTEAIKHLQITLEKTPDDIPSMQQLSSAYMQLGDTAKSIDYLEKILQIDPFNKIAANEYQRVKKN